MTRNEWRAVKNDVKSAGEAAPSENDAFSDVPGCLLDGAKVCFKDENFREDWLCDVVGLVGERTLTFEVECEMGGVGAEVVLRPVRERRKDHSDSNWTGSREGGV